jgi:hypothetical protein
MEIATKKAEVAANGADMAVGHRKEDMSKRLATWDGEQKSKRRNQAEGGTKRGRSGDTDAVAVYGDCKKRKTDTDAEEALHRRIDEYEID